MTKHTPRPNQQVSRPSAPAVGQPSRPTEAEIRSRESAEDGDQDAIDAADERIIRRDDQEGRGDRGITEDAARDSELADLMSDAEYEALVRSEFEQVSLPTPPALRGWHLCWLTTSSQYDTISKRQRIGYRPVRTSEMPGFDPSNGQRLARYEDFVTCNEMVLHKIPEAYYQKMMNLFHHKRPSEGDENALRHVQNGLKEKQDSAGRPLSETLGTGYLDMDREAKKVERQPFFSS